jgi:ATP-binding cassette subfamily F protein 3
VYEFRNKKIKQHLGGIYDFLLKKKMESLKELEKKQIGEITPKVQVISDDENQVDLSFDDKKNINKAISRIEKNIETMEKRISLLEEKLAEMDEMLADSSRITSDDIFLNYEKTKSELSEAFREWESEHIVLEEWKTKKTW